MQLSALGLRAMPAHQRFGRVYETSAPWRIDTSSTEADTASKLAFLNQFDALHGAARIDDSRLPEVGPTAPLFNSRFMVVPRMPEATPNEVQLVGLSAPDTDTFMRTLTTNLIKSEDALADRQSLNALVDLDELPTLNTSMLLLSYKDKPPFRKVINQTLEETKAKTAPPVQTVTV